ncbi:MAG: hypothetical protein Q9217_002070 [Psora testacea]
MGPSRLFHKNRSAHSLLSSQDANEKARFQPSPVESPLHSPAYPPPGQYEEEKEKEEQVSKYDNVPYHSEEAPFYHQSGHPTRSRSQRSPSLINTNLAQPTINLVRPAHSSPSSAVDETSPDQFYRQIPASNPPAQKEDRKKRRFFGLGGSSKDSANNPAPTRLGRSISIRRREQLPDTFEEPGRRPSQQQWPSTHISPTDDYEEDEEGGAGLHPPQGVGYPLPPEKDPLRSPGLPSHITQQDHYRRRSEQVNTSPTQGHRHPLDRQVSYESSWARASSNIHHRSHGDSGQQQTPSSYHPSPASATSTGSGHYYQKSQTDTLHQHWQDQQPSRPSSSQSLEPHPPAQYPRSYEQHHTRATSSQASSFSQYTQGSMGPPPQPQGSGRRASEAQQHQGEQGREGGYQPYAQPIQGGSVLASSAPLQYSGLAPQGQNYRANPQPSPMQQQGGNEQGRSTPPPPSRSRDDLSNLDVAQLLQRHDELQDKYRKVKKYYFDKDAQVQQLQNTLAHQRLSLSRTSLDDNEYANRFSRLDGAINNLAFNIRRDWRQVPPWLAPHVNRDATTSPTKEMTAVGRAAISRWLVDELLERYFHPGLEPGLSAHLKIIEKNLRRLAPPTPSDEEKDALLAKISNWRLSTLDGLQDVLASSQATEYRASLTQALVEKLVANLGMMLKDPAPVDLEGGVSMIVELAVGIAANLPLESRDVFVEYIVPGQAVNEAFMKIETGLPALTSPGDAPSEGETASLASKQTEETGSIDSRETGNSNGNGLNEENDTSPQGQSQQTSTKQKKKSMFGNFISGGGAGSKKGSIASASSGGQQGQAPPAGGQHGSGERKEEKVRFSTFIAVEVRGRSVLIKAPVYVRE